jgi:hypothetical protein
LIRKAVPAVPFDMTNWTYRRLYTCHVYQFIWTFIQVTDSAPSFWPVWTFSITWSPKADDPYEEAPDFAYSRSSDNLKQPWLAYPQWLLRFNNAFNPQTCTPQRDDTKLREKLA